MLTPKEIKEKIAILSMREDLARKASAVIDKDMKLPLHLRVQIEKPNGELRYPNKAKDLELSQEAVFMRVIKKRHPQLSKEANEMFAQYYLDFLAGKCRNINDFLYKNRMGSWDNNNLKSEFV